MKTTEHQVLPNSNYKDIYAIRRDNLILLAERYASYAELKTILGISSSYLSELVSKDLRKKVSDNTARQIEVAAELPNGWLDNIHTGKTEDIKKIPVFNIEQLSMKNPVAYKHFTISISNEYICDFCIEIGTSLENPLLPSGTIALFKKTTDPRFLRNGDVVIIKKGSLIYLNYYKLISNKRYLVSLYNLKKEELFDDKIILIAKMVYAIMKNVSGLNSNFDFELD